MKQEELFQFNCCITVIFNWVYCNSQEHFCKEKYIFVILRHRPNRHNSIYFSIYRMNKIYIVSSFYNVRSTRMILSSLIYSVFKILISCLTLIFGLFNPDALKNLCVLCWHFVFSLFSFLFNLAYD